MATKSETKKADDPSRLVDLLTRKTSGRGEIIATEPELLKMFTEAKCTTKTDMMMYLYNAGHPANSIAKTLAEVGILSPKSAYPHVRNTIERKTAKAAKSA